MLVTCSLVEALDQQVPQLAPPIPSPVVRETITIPSNHDSYNTLCTNWALRKDTRDSMLKHGIHTYNKPSA